MIKLKNKLIISAMVFTLALITMQLSIYATNENIEIVQNNNNDYLIYVKDNLDKDFNFAFSNNKNEDKALLKFKKAETDSTEEANRIAFVNSTTINLFKNPTYMWVKDNNENYIIDGIQIDLKESIDAKKLSDISNITKVIPADTKQTNTTETEVNGKKITTTVGKVVLQKTKGSYEYIIVKLPYMDEYEKLMKLATRISEFNNETDLYTKISIYKDFNKLVEELRPNSDSNWIKVENNEIEQPKDAEDGTQYVLWINENNGNESKQDVQFLTSTKKVSEEKITEKITTKLPVTYDNNLLLVVLVILVILAIVAGTRIKTLNKRKKQI